MQKWDVRGVWKADGGAAEMNVEAANQKAAEHIAAGRGMLVESCWPAAEMAMPVATTTAYVGAGGAHRASGITFENEDEAYGLSFSAAFWIVLVGLVLSPAVIGIPIIIWGVLARSKIAKAKKINASVRLASNPKSRGFPVAPINPTPARKRYD